MLRQYPINLRGGWRAACLSLGILTATCGNLFAIERQPAPGVQAPGSQAPRVETQGLPPRLGEILRDLERRFEQQEGEREQRLREFKRELDEGRRNLMEENEDLRRAAEKAVEDLTGEVQRYMESRGIDLEKRLKEMEKLVKEQGEAWFQQLQEWEQGPEKEEEVPEGSAPIGLTFYVLAQGLPWEGSQPLPTSLSEVAAALDVDPSELLLLDKIYVRTGTGAQFKVNSHLPDLTAARPLPCTITVTSVGRGPAGQVTLGGLSFESRITFPEDDMRVIYFGGTAELAPGQPTLLGTASVRGAGQAIVLVGLAETGD